MKKNRFVFESKNNPLAVVCQRVGRQLEKFNVYSSRIYGRLKKQKTFSSKCCRAPRARTLKINTYAFLRLDGWVTLGVVARDLCEKVCLLEVRRTRACWPQEVARC